MKKKMLALALLLCAVFAFALCTAAAECNHNYVEQVGRVPATCTAKGSIPYTCSKCGEQKTEEIPMLEHDFVESARVSSTCLHQKARKPCVCGLFHFSYTNFTRILGDVQNGFVILLC